MLKTMVKIKEGYVMNAREKAEFDRVDALPRKREGTVAYYFKPQTKYPPRIYIFMHAEIWCDRNRRPMGLQYAFPFLTRPMNKERSSITISIFGCVTTSMRIGANSFMLRSRKRKDWTAKGQVRELFF